MTLQLKWALADRGEAEAYGRWADARSPFAPAPFAYLWEYPPSAAYPGGALVAPYLGPPMRFDGEVMAEPDGGPAMRAKAELGVFAPPEQD